MIDDKKTNIRCTSASPTLSIALNYILGSLRVASQATAVSKLTQEKCFPEIENIDCHCKEEVKEKPKEEKKSRKKRDKQTDKEEKGEEKP